MMRLGSILVVICIPWSAAQAQIHYWIDENGIQHYSCDPPSDKNTVKDYQVFATLDDAPKRVDTPNNRSASDPSSSEFPEIIMYTTSWCGYCKQARTWLNDHGVPYTNYDIEKSDVGRAGYNRLGGRGVPLIQVGDHLMNGWSEVSMKKYLGMD